MGNLSPGKGQGIDEVMPKAERINRDLEARRQIGDGQNRQEEDGGDVIYGITYQHLDVLRSFKVVGAHHLVLSDCETVVWDAMDLRSPAGTLSVRTRPLLI